jgi:diadenylate cyclase
MDGAILLTKRTHILHANVQLMPDASIESQETGTRHRTAERVAKQIDSLAISISAARDVVTVYVGDIRYIMDPIRTILDKADQALRTMEKFRARFNEMSTSLSLLEYQDAVTLYDVLSVLQRAEMMLVIVQLIDSYVVQLGTEGRLVELQLEEMLVNVREERAAVLEDYLPDIGPDKLQAAKTGLAAVPSDDLLSLSNVGAAVGFGPDAEPLDKHMRPRGYRMLGKIPRISDQIVGAVVSRFGDLKAVVDAPLEDLAAVDGVGILRARDIKEGLIRIHELSLLERRG